MTENDFKKLCIEKLADSLEVIAMEECSELIQAISKMKRGKLEYYDNLCEEIADVILCIDWIKEKYKVKEDEVNNWLTFKKKRCLTRIDNNEFK